MLLFFDFRLNYYRFAVMLPPKHDFTEKGVQKMKVIIFGGSGWLGHNISKILAAANMDITIVTRGRKQTFAGEITGIKSIVADKSDEAAMKEIFETRYTHVIDTVPSVKSLELIHTFHKVIHRAASWNISKFFGDNRKNSRIPNKSVCTETKY